MFDVNYWAVIAATVFSMVLGVVWYTPLTFGSLWMKIVGIDSERMTGAEEARAYLTGAVSHCIGVFLLAVLMNSAGLSGWLPGLAAGLAVSLGFMATSRGTNYVYEKRPMALFLINSGYNVVFYAVAGALLGVWH